MTTSTPQRPAPQTAGQSRDALASLRIERPDPYTVRRSGRRWLWLIGLIILLGGGFAAYHFGALAPVEGLADNPTWMPEIMQKRIDVRLTTVSVQKGRSADAVVVANGYLQSRRQARIGARAAGRIDVINFDEGYRVTEGEVLAELEHKDLDASLAAAKASVTRARAALAEQEITIEQALVDKKRAEKLWPTGGISEQEYDQARFAHQTAVARRDSLAADIELAEARQQQEEQLKENMFIRAPFDGTVISKDAEVGESILPGGMGQGSGRGSVATIADLDHLEIQCDVQESFIARVSEGQEADIEVDAVQDKKYHGTVRKIIPMGDRARATIKVEVAIEDADKLLFPEMAGTVYFLPTKEEIGVSDEPRVFCPSSAVDSDDEGNQFVWMPDEEKRAKKVAVKAGQDRDGRTEILEGLVGRERVVANPEEIYEGAPLQIVE